MNLKSAAPLRWAAVHWRMTEKTEAVIFGAILVENSRHVVLVNSIRSGAGLGKLKATQREHIEPECDVFVIPRNRITKVEIKKRTGKR